MNNKPNPPNPPHVMVVPYPAQGHMNPMVQFLKRLSFHGIHTSLATTIFISKSIPSDAIPTHHGSDIRIRPISDGFDEGGPAHAPSTEAYLASLRDVGSKTLEQLIKRLKEEGEPVTAIIYDGFLPWVMDVAKHAGIPGVIFFTQSCAVNSIYYHVQRGMIQLPLVGPSPGTIKVPGVPELRPWEAPSYIDKYGSYPFWFDVVLSQFSNIDLADWVLCNVFYEMESEVVDWMSKMWKVRPIGPTIPSYYLDKRLEHDKDYNLHLFHSTKSLYSNWLNTKSKNSVIYVSFGSMADLTQEQYQELAHGLKASPYNFLWVVRESEQPKLPVGFVDKCFGLGQGVIVGWTSQLEVLAHEATGCFLTHCGFNSVLEALCLGVPVVALPQWTDQGTNAKFVEDVWGIGMRIKVDERGIARRDEVKECVMEVMEGEKREKIQKNVDKWKKLAKEAADEGGSSDKNVSEFVNYLWTLID